MSITQAIGKEVKSYHWFVQLMLLLVLVGAAAAVYRFVFGLGATTNLNDRYPWGLWVSFDVVTAVPLAAGSFTLGAIVYCFNIKKLEPLIRPAIVTGFLGYSLVCVGLLVDLGQPHKGWHVLFFWNLHSPMFEVAMCVFAYTTVLFLEFLEPVGEKFGWNLSLKVLRKLHMPLVIAAAGISTLHQSSLGTFFLIAVEKLHSLWYNPLLPLQFWISAISCGLCIIILEATATHKWMNQPNEGVLLRTIGKILPWTIGAYLVVRVFSLFFLTTGPLFDNPVMTRLFTVEMGGFVLALLMFSTTAVRNNDRLRAIAASVLVLTVILHRFNVSMFGMMDMNNIYYPSMTETLVTVGILAAHILFFVLIAKYFRIFVHSDGHEEPAQSCPSASAYSHG